MVRKKISATLAQESALACIDTVSGIDISQGIEHLCSVKRKRVQKYQ
jgi:hypothetical protein